ncbi:hypothetical protein [Ideonella sp. YS5]|uniref:hypothetical protein n=1 Tax=Ideonella sp. YS5 TaxID=3453714 RepID=UPI003EE90880
MQYKKTSSAIDGGLMPKALRSSAVSAVLALACHQVSAAPAYAVAEAYSNLNAYAPVDLNEREHVAFQAARLDGSTTGVVCKKKCRDVPPLVNDDSAYARLAAIDSHGRAVGQSPAQHTYLHAILFDGKSTVDLGAFAEDDCGGCSLASWANDINDKGQVVGLGLTADGWARGALWEEGVIQKLPTLGGDVSEAYAINDHGVIVGRAETGGPTKQGRAFVYRRGQMFDLGVLGTGTGSIAFDINRSNQIVGDSSTDGADAIRPFLFADGIMREIPLPLAAITGTAWRINDAGWVIGTYLPVGSPRATPHGFVYNGEGTFDLNDVISPEDQAKWLIRSASAINESGQILVSATQRSNETIHVLLLTPGP